MQQNIVIGNIVRINTVDGTNKVFMTIADHFVEKDKPGQLVHKVQEVPGRGYLPKRLTQELRPLVAVEFRFQSLHIKTA